MTAVPIGLPTPLAAYRDRAQTRKNEVARLRAAAVEGVASVQLDALGSLPFDLRLLDADSDEQYRVSDVTFTSRAKLNVDTRLSQLRALGKRLGSLVGRPAPVERQTATLVGLIRRSTTRFTGGRAAVPEKNKMTNALSPPKRIADGQAAYAYQQGQEELSYPAIIGALDDADATVPLGGVPMVELVRDVTTARIELDPAILDDIAATAHTPEQAAGDATIAVIKAATASYVGLVAHRAPLIQEAGGDRQIIDAYVEALTLVAAKEYALTSSTEPERGQLLESIAARRRGLSDGQSLASEAFVALDALAAREGVNSVHAGNSHAVPRVSGEPLPGWLSRVATVARREAEQAPTDFAQPAFDRDGPLLTSVLTPEVLEWLDSVRGAMKLPPLPEGAHTAPSAPEAPSVPTLPPNLPAQSLDPVPATDPPTYQAKHARQAKDQRGPKDERGPAAPTSAVRPGQARGARHKRVTGAP